MADADALFPVPYARGVYLSRVRAGDGSPIVFAIDSRGRTAGKHIIRGATTVDGAIRLLRAHLDETDPTPHLTLVRDSAEPPAAPAHVHLALWGKLTGRSAGSSDRTA